MNVGDFIFFDKYYFNWRVKRFAVVKPNDEAFVEVYMAERSIVNCFLSQSEVGVADDVISLLLLL